MPAKTAKHTQEPKNRQTEKNRKTPAAGGTPRQKTPAGKQSDSSRSVGNAAVTVRHENTKDESPADRKEQTNPVLIREVFLWCVIALGIFIFISYLGFGGMAGGAVSDVSFGVFGLPAYLLPFFLVFSTAFLVSNRGSSLAVLKFSSALILYLIICSFSGLLRAEEYMSMSIGDIYRRSAAMKNGGGAVGGAVCRFLAPALGTIGTAVILVILAVICLILITQRSLMRSFKNQGQKMYHSAKEESERRRRASEEAGSRRAEHIERSYVPVSESAGSSAGERWTADTRKLPDPVSAKHHDSTEQKKKTKSTEKKELRNNSSSKNQFVIDGIDRKNPDGEIDIPAIFPSVPTERRSTRKVSGITNDTLMTDQTAATANRGREMRQIIPDISSENSQNTYDSFAFHDHAGEETRYADPDNTKHTTSRSDSSSDLMLEIEGIEQDSDLSYFENPADDSRKINQPDERKTSSRSSVQNVSVFASDEDISHNTSAGKTFRSGPDASGKPEQQAAGRAHRTIQTEPDAASLENGSGSASPAEHSPKRNPRSSAKEIQEGIADVQAEMEKATEIVKEAYVFPPLDLLKRGSARSAAGQELEVRQTAAKLQTTLDSFGVRARVTNVSCGPSVTRYELTPEQGVKVKQIVALSDDIKLNLAATDIRIEAPIPGKSAVGIEVPNGENSMVKLRDLLETEEFEHHKSNLAFAVGKDIGGKTVVTDIAKMPHLLIAGATGSGKSVCINTLIMSLLYKADPEDVKLIMIDPKVVELSVYNGIPHLFIPVVTDPKKAAGALNWAVSEMDDRYRKFAEYGVRDLKGYNQRVEALDEIEDPNKPKKMPQIVIIVDELADLMMVAPGEVEDAICRLAQLARAAGIHLIIATQRPSVNVITGLIKANMPSRIAFSVSSGIDSRTIIDMYGAEKLLGKGDMLFYPQGYQKPARVQGAFVSDEEVSDVVDFLKDRNAASFSSDMEARIASVQQAGSAASRNEDVDALFTEAGKFIIEKDKASIGMLQRVFKIGFNRAARIMDQLSDAGIVGPEEGTKPRKILMSMEEFENYLEQN